ncbi:MAG: endonuclease/exonuclease/phosphatase family protein [Dinoroseobacter sp.]|nr:endonuclease/exonuclease/phosphatase family protein [Dinoroseobacter sp.]
MRIATFNVQNLRLRQDADGPRLDGARDRDDGLPESLSLDVMDRRLTADIIARIDADILCMQEVFDLATLDHFQETFFGPAVIQPYPHRTCEPGNDGHGLNVAMMARIAPDRVKSHAQKTATDLGLEDPGGILQGGPVFRRDCLEVGFGALTLFICHFKAPYPDRQRATAIRGLEAQAVRRVIETSLQNPETQSWMIVGDLNTPVGTDTREDHALKPLLDGFATDLMRRMPEGEDWTFSMPDTGKRLRPDAMLASPALAKLAAHAVPQVERRGMDTTAAEGSDYPLSEVRSPRPHASDHAAVWIDLPDAIIKSGTGADRGPQAV